MGLNTTMVGTGHFRSVADVRRYYGNAEAAEALAEGRVEVGEPEIKRPRWQRLKIDNDGRYWIECDDHTATYRAQCRTYAVARIVTRDYREVTDVGAITQPPHCLRIRKDYRNKTAQDFRDEVAAKVRQLRKVGKVPAYHWN